MPNNSPDHKFVYLFWFCAFVFVLSFSAMMCLIYVPFPDANRDMAFGTQGFIQGSLIMSAVGFLLTGSINAAATIKSKPTGPGSVDFSLSAHTETPTDSTPKPENNAE